VGVSSLAGGHLTLVPELRQELTRLGREDIMIVVGGVILPQDYPALFEAGAAAVFGPGTVIGEAAEMLLKELGMRVGITGVPGVGLPSMRPQLPMTDGDLSEDCRE
jgi:methylmalonyl-CoA mutase